MWKILYQVTQLTTLGSMEDHSGGDQRPDDDLDDDSSVSGPSTPYYMSGSSGAASPSAVSAEEDDYRSETSSERGGDSHSLSALARAKSSLRRIPAQAAASAHSNHRDLSNRLKRAICNAAQTDAMPFDEHMIGVDVLLCVQPNDEPTQDAEDSEAQHRTVFHAHRFLLAASSEPFRAMLTGNMREASQRQVQIFGVEPRIVEKMLVFIYTGGESWRLGSWSVLGCN